jgi:putative toxin-antitoxin system antitoxin component (TIGR02293 family)
MSQQSLSRALAGIKGQARKGGPKRVAVVDVVARATGRPSAYTLAHSPYLGVYFAEPLTRVTIVKEGLPATYLDMLAKSLNITKDRLLPTLGIAQATVSRKVRLGQPLSTDDSERALGMARLIGQVEAMVQQSGDPTGFDAAKWLAGWLDEPAPALGGRAPSSLMDTAEGQAMVSGLLARMQSGAYA